VGDGRMLEAEEILEELQPSLPPSCSWASAC